jgi:hypothetical protein
VENCKSTLLNRNIGMRSRLLFQFGNWARVTCISLSKTGNAEMEAVGIEGLKFLPSVAGFMGRNSLCMSEKYLANKSTISVEVDTF